MRISAKSDYAIRAMSVLAEASDGGAVRAEDIAQQQDIPLNFLLGILRELRNAHLVRSVRGRDGGYLLSRPADEIALADVIRAVDGPLANVRDLSCPTPAPRKRCATSGWRCEAAFARCSRTSASATSLRASCRVRCASLPSDTRPSATSGPLPAPFLHTPRAAVLPTTGTGTRLAAASARSAASCRPPMSARL